MLGEALSKHITGEPANITVESDTRQAFAVMLYDIITASAPDAVTSDAKAMTFDDVDDIDENAKQALAYLYSNGVVRGDDMNMLMPASVITKEEAVTMLVRVYDLLASSTK